LIHGKEVIYNILANLFLQAVTIISGLILPSMIIRIFGSEINGMISSIKQFIAYLNIVEAGIGGASVVALYKPLAENNSISRNTILAATKKFYNKSGWLFVILVIILSLVYPHLINLQKRNYFTGSMVLILGVTGALEFFLIGKYRVLLMADRKNYVTVLIQALGTIVNTLAAVILLKHFNMSILVIQALASLIYLSRYFLLYAYIKKKYPDLSFNVPPNNEALKQKWDVLIHQIAGLVVFGSPVILLTVFCDLKAVSIYTIYSMIFLALGSLLDSFSNGIQAFFGKLLVADNNDRAKTIFQKYETLYFIIMGWVYSAAYILTIPFMKIYTHNMTDAEYIQPVLALLFVIVGVANKLRVPGILLITGIGHYQETKNRAILEAVINIIFSLIFINIYGLPGVLIGTVCSFLYRTVDTLIYTATKILTNTIKKTLFKITVIGFSYIVLVHFILFIPFSFGSYYQWFRAAVLIGLLLSVVGGIYITISLKNLIILKSRKSYD
jgi:O-antigen/teichoic acid export membrane protein